MERYKDKQLSAYERAAALADTLSTEEQAQQLKELMEFFETEPKIVERKERMVVYLKEGSQIVDLLNVMEAYVSLMNLENVRI